MKKTALFALALACGSVAFSQNVDPVLMTIDGKPITRSEFEYSYNKNGNIEGAVEQKTVDEYVDMFINYKLKVAAAEAAQLDTLTSFRKEFEQYRDMQLTPHLVDSSFIDSIARSVYHRTEEQLKGQDMLRVAHILLMVKQNAPAEEAERAEARIDSIYKVAAGGADFADLARRFSQDPGSAAKGGELPWIGPGMTLKDFEDAAYALKTGELSHPVKSSVGYHILKMLERKQLEPYDTLRSEIVAGLKRQGIEEASAEERIKKILAANPGRLTREAVMDSVLAAEMVRTPDLKYLIAEYHDGLLLYEISKRQVWEPATQNVKDLEQVFKKGKKKYAWNEQRFKGFVIQAKNTKALKLAIKVLKKNADGDWRKAVREQVNHDSILVRVSGPYLVKKGENAYVDECVFDGDEAPRKGAFTEVGVSGKKLSKPKTYLDVKAQVEADYQEQLEQAWIAELRKRFTVNVDKAVLSTVNKH